MQTFQNAIKAGKNDTDSLESKLTRFLLVYHSTLNTTTGESPAELLFHRLIRTRLSLITPNSLKSVIENYAVLQEEFNICLESYLEPDIRSRITGVKHQMYTFEFFSGVYIGERILKHTDNLSRTLQRKDMSVTEGQEVASLSVKRLQCMRDESTFTLFWAAVQQLASKYDIGEPSLPRRRKVPQRLEVCSSEPKHPSSPKEYYKWIYYEALDLVISVITFRVDLISLDMLCTKIWKPYL